MPPSFPPAASLALFAVLASVPAEADDFLRQEAEVWRSSRLVGVDVFGPDGGKVGSVRDVLVGKDGRAAYVILGVGGKDVAIRFDRVRFSRAPPTRPAAPAGGASAGAAPADGPANTGTFLGAPSANTGLEPNFRLTPFAPDPASDPEPTGPKAGVSAGAAGATPPRGGSGPDHGVVDYTADQLKAAPDFAYTR